MKKNLLHLFSIAFFSLIALSVQAQEYGMEFANDGYNHNSLRPIHESQIMYKKTLWFKVSLKEKQNKPFFASNNEITKVIFEAAKMGIIRPYENDSLTTRMSTETFLEKLKIPSDGPELTEEEIAMGFGADDLGGWGGGGDDWGSGGDWGGGDGGGSAATEAAEFQPKQITIMQIREDLLFDKKRSRMIHDIQSIGFYIPAELNTKMGTEKRLAFFSYKELVSNLFRDNPKAIWYNNNNNAHHRNLEEAFDLRLFTGKIIKYDNIDDEMIIDMNDGDSQRALIGSEQYEYKQIEYESNLWEN
jgi:hypothetical protein